MSKRRKTFAVGSRVRLTGAFLRSTGQYTGPEPQSVWTVQECSCGLCRDGRFVATDETSYDGEGQRHIAAANLQKVRGR